MATEISERMGRIAEGLKVTFMLNAKPINVSEVFAETGLLPAIAKRADQLCSFCFDYGLGISFDEIEPSLLGVRVIFDDVTPMVLRYMLMTDIIMDIISVSPNKEQIELDELLYD